MRRLPGRPAPGAHLHLVRKMTQGSGPDRRSGRRSPISGARPLRGDVPGGARDLPRVEEQGPGHDSVTGTLRTQLDLEAVDGQVSSWADRRPCPAQSRTPPSPGRAPMADRTDPLMGDLRTEQSVDQHARQARAFDEVGPHRRPAPVRSRLTELDTPLNTACRVPTPHVVVLRSEAAFRHGGDSTVPVHSKAQRSDRLTWDVGRTSTDPARSLPALPNSPCSQPDDRPRGSAEHNPTGRAKGGGDLPGPRPPHSWCVATFIPRA